MAEMPHADLLRGELTGALQKDVETLKTIFGLPENADIVFRPFEAGVFSLCAVYTEGMAKDDKVADFILRACHAFDAGAERVDADMRADFLLTHEPDGLENGLVKVTNVPGMFEWLCENRDLDYTQIEI